jgi:hypothetical protein
MATLAITYGQDNNYTVEFELQHALADGKEWLMRRYVKPETRWEPCVRAPENREILDDIERILRKYDNAYT